MEGIQFPTNVQIDLRKHGAVWEDVYVSLIVRKRSKEPPESLDSVKKRQATKTECLIIPFPLLDPRGRGALLAFRTT